MASKKKHVKRTRKVHAYDPRLATARALSAELDAVGCLAGLMVKAVRDYKAGGEGRQTQDDVAKKAGVSQGTVSNLEAGKRVPQERNLTKVLNAMGLDFTEPGGAALKALLEYIRDHGKNLKQLSSEPPK